jgi:hypothetical protein
MKMYFTGKSLGEMKQEITKQYKKNEFVNYERYIV